MSHPPDPPTPRSTIAKRVAFAVLAIAALLVLGRLGGRYVPGFVARIRSFGALGPIVYILGYMVAMVAGIPASLLTLAAGAIFGLQFGALWSLPGATLGASAAFLVARYVARGRVEKRVAREPRLPPSTARSPTMGDASCSCSAFRPRCHSHSSAAAPALEA